MTGPDRRGRPGFLIDDDPAPAADLLALHAAHAAGGLVEGPPLDALDVVAAMRLAASTLRGEGLGLATAGPDARRAFYTLLWHFHGRARRPAGRSPPERPPGGGRERALRAALHR